VLSWRRISIKIAFVGIKTITRGKKIVMRIQLNEQSLTLPAACSLEAALKTHGYTDQQHCAVALNKTFVPKSRYAETLLQEGDSIEVLAPMQGG
jgi:sulfur carrier protein